MDSVADFLTGSVSPAHLLYTIDHHFLCKSWQFLNRWEKNFLSKSNDCTKWETMLLCFWSHLDVVCSYECSSPLLWNHHEGQNCRDWGRKRLEMLVFYYPTLTHLQAVTVTLHNSQIHVLETQTNHLSLPSTTVGHFCCAHTQRSSLKCVLYAFEGRVLITVFAPPPVLKSALSRQMKWARVCTQQNTLPLMNHEKVNYASLGEWLGSVVITAVSDT